MCIRINLRYKSFEPRGECLLEQFYRATSGLRGGVVFRRLGAAEQAFSAQVLVDIRPVDAIASTSNFPIPTLSVLAFRQARIPDKRHADHAALVGDSTQASSLNATSSTRSSAVIAGDPIATPPRPTAPRPSQSPPLTPHTAAPPDGTRPLSPPDPAAPASAWSKPHKYRSCTC